MSGKLTRTSSDSAVREDRTDWVRVRSLTDEEIEEAIRMDPDSFAMEEADLATLTGATHQYQLYRDANERWRWVLRSSKGDIVAVSGQSFGSRADALSAIEQVRAALIGGGSEAA